MSHPGPVWHILAYVGALAVIIGSVILFVRALVYFDRRSKRRPKSGRGAGRAARRRGGKNGGR